MLGTMAAIWLLIQNYHLNGDAQDVEAVIMVPAPIFPGLKIALLGLKYVISAKLRAIYPRCVERNILALTVHLNQHHKRVPITHIRQSLKL